METDGFVLVKPTRKRRVRNKPKLQPVHGVGLQADVGADVPLNLDHIIHQISVQDTEICDQVQGILSTHSISEIICYGIGKLSSCKLAQHQFATLVNILQQNPGTPCWVYDPALSAREKHYISSHMGLLPRNDMCRRRVSSRTLFFMVHSSTRMYDNVLKSNWDQLHRCVIIGNSFLSYKTHGSDKALERKVPHVYHSIRCVVETQLCGFNSYPNVFNDTVVLHFPEPACHGGVFSESFSADTADDGKEIIGDEISGTEDGEKEVVSGHC